MIFWVKGFGYCIIKDRVFVKYIGFQLLLTLFRYLFVEIVFFFHNSVLNLYCFSIVCLYCFSSFLKF